MQASSAPRLARTYRAKALAREREIELQGGGLVSGPARIMALRVVDHHQAAFFAGDDLVNHLITAAATGRGAAVVTDLRDAAGAGGSNRTTDISIGEGVAVTDKHRRSNWKIAT
jgi:hypothetical protein